MSLHPRHEDFSNADQPHTGHRLAAAAFMTLPATSMLTATLWAVAGSCASGGAFAGTAAMIFAGLLPFALTTQLLPGTQTASRMRFGQLSLVAALFALFVLFGPGPVFLGVSCGTGPSILQSGLLVVTLGWTSWWAMRSIDTAQA